MSQAAIADRYARALFELGNESGNLESLTRQISNFAQTYEVSKELQNVLENPLIMVSERLAVLADIGSRLGLNSMATNAIKLLADRRRLRALPAIARRLMKLADEHAGVIRATIVSPKPLSDSFLSQLRSELEQASKRKVVLEKETDPSLIAGVVAHIGDRTIDGSLKGRLNELERRLLA